MKNIKKILFVCTGNSCRSVMAEFLLKKKIKDSKKLDSKEYKVYSAGISPMEGMHPPEKTVQVLKNEEIDVSNYKARRVTPKMIKKADVVLVMQGYHKESVGSMSEDKDKIYLLKEYCISRNEKSREDLNIPDPIGQSLEAYEVCLLTIKNCLNEFIQELEECRL